MCVCVCVLQEKSINFTHNDPLTIITLFADHIFFFSTDLFKIELMVTRFAP